jgi:hypothetical protein
LRGESPESYGLRSETWGFEADPERREQRARSVNSSSSLAWLIASIIFCATFSTSPAYSSVVLDRDPGALDGAAAHQHATLAAMDVPVAVRPDALEAATVGTVVDALVGYGLAGPLGGAATALVEAIPETVDHVVSLDIPSGVNATTGDAPGPSASPDLVMTLALPKTALDPTAYRLLLADIASRTVRSPG